MVSKNSYVIKKFEKVYHDPFHQFDPFGEGHKLGLDALNKSLKLIKAINKYNNTHVVSAYQTIIGKREEINDIITSQDTTANEILYRPLPLVFMNVQANMNNLENIIQFFDKKNILPINMVSSKSKNKMLNDFQKKINPNYNISLKYNGLTNIESINNFISEYHNIDTNKNPIDIIKFLSVSP